MRAEILIIEDVREMAELMQLYLKNEGFTTCIKETAEEALEQLGSQHFDLIFLDLNLPGMDGFEFLSHLRKVSTTPVVIVSARSEDEDIIMGLGLGADEFVVKPFSPKVLAVRARAILRRTLTTGGQTAERYRFGPFLFEPEAYLLKKGNDRIALSMRECEILAFLIRNAGKAFTAEKIYQQVWKNEFGDLTAVGVYIQRLRKKLEAVPAQSQYLQTIHGAGYCFNREYLETLTGGTV